MRKKPPKSDTERKLKQRQKQAASKAITKGEFHRILTKVSQPVKKSRKNFGTMTRGVARAKHEVNLAT